MNITSDVATLATIKAALNQVGCTTFLDTLDENHPQLRAWPSPSQWAKAQSLLPQDLPLTVSNPPAVFSTPKQANQFALYLGCLSRGQSHQFTTIPDGDGWAVVWHEDALMV